MGIVQFLYHPDTVLTAPDIETLAKGVLSELRIPGAEGCGFDAGVIWRTVLDAAVDQKSIKAVTETSLKTSSDDYTLAQFHTVPAEEFEDIVNGLLPEPIVFG